MVVLFPSLLYDVLVIHYFDALGAHSGDLFVTLVLVPAFQPSILCTYSLGACKVRLSTTYSTA